MSEDNLNPDQEEQSKPLTFRGILWKRTKRPAVFIATCLVAAFALFYLQEARLDFAKKKIAPLIIVPERSDEKANPYLREATQKELSDLLFANVSKELIKNVKDEEVDKASKDKLIQQLNKKFPTEKQTSQTTTAPQQPVQNDELFDLSEISNPNSKLLELVGLIKKRQILISQIVDSTKYQTFKNDDELIIGLFSSLGIIKERDLKTNRDNLAAAIKEKLEISMQRDFAKRLLEAFKDEQLANAKKTAVNPKSIPTQPNKFIDKDQYYFEAIQTWNVKQTLGGTSEQKNTSAGLGEVLNFLKQNGDQKTLGYEQIQNGISDTYTNKNARVEEKIADIEKSIEQTNVSFEPIYKNVYATLKNKDVIKTVFPPKTGNPISRNIFDLDNNLSVIYKIFEYTLVAVIIFGLLYVILIPLKHIFFITTNTGDLTDQGKSFLNRSDVAVAGSNISNKMILAATTIGLGAAVLTGAAISGGAEKKPGNEIAEATEISNLNKNPNVNKKPYLPTDAADIYNTNIATQQIEVDQLARSITALNGEFGILVKALNDANFPETINRIDGNLKNIGDVVGTPKDDENSKTINGRMISFSEKYKTVPTDLNNISRNFDGFKKSNTTLAGEVGKITDSLGTTKEFNEQVNSVNPKTPPQNLLGAMGGVWRTLGTTRYISTHGATGKNDLLDVLDTINTKIGNPKVAGVNSLFTDLRQVSNGIGVGTVHDKTSVLERLHNVNGNLVNVTNTLGSYNSSDRETLFGYTQNVVGRRTNEIGSFIVGNDGNMFKQVRGLFTGNRYVINYFTVAELNTYNSALKDPDLTQIIKVIEEIARTNNQTEVIPAIKLLTADELIDAIQTKSEQPGMVPINEQMWDKHKDLVLRSARVARY